MKDTIHILAFAGSLRKTSYNRGLLKVALEEVPASCTLEIFDLRGIPLFNQDEENPLPQSVSDFKAKIREADALLIATPEYNYSVPGVLKNALDWGSRPSGDSAWNDKLVAIMGASPSFLGTARAQYHLRQILVGLNMYPLNRPELMVSSAQNKFDANGHLTDSSVRQSVKELLKALEMAVLLRRKG